MIKVEANLALGQELEREKYMAKVPELLSMMKAGVHFGHSTSRWHPKMAPFIFAVRQGIHIVDLELTAKQMQTALDFIEEITSQGKEVLWVATKKQAQGIIKKYAEETHSPYVVEKWLGGTFTNFHTIQNLLKKFDKLEKQKLDGTFQKYTKREQLEFDREIERLQYLVGGIRQLKNLPGAVFMIDTKEDKTARLEASKIKIPIVAITDTNINPTSIDYPIPGNDDAVKAIELYCLAVAEAIKIGKAKYEKERLKHPLAKSINDAKPTKANLSSNKKNN